MSECCDRLIGPLVVEMISTGLTSTASCTFTKASDRSNSRNVFIIDFRLGTIVEKYKEETNKLTFRDLSTLWRTETATLSEYMLILEMTRRDLTKVHFDNLSFFMSSLLSKKGTKVECCNYLAMLTGH